MTGRQYLPPKKRARGTATGHTPNQAHKRPALRTQKLISRRKPTYGEQGIKGAVVQDGWSIKEESALVEFILLHGDGCQWVYTKKPKFWQSASNFCWNVVGLGEQVCVCEREITMGPPVILL